MPSGLSWEYSLHCFMLSMLIKARWGSAQKQYVVMFCRARMAQAAWEAALIGSGSNVSQQNQHQTLSPAVSRIVVQGSKALKHPDIPSAAASDSDSDDETDKDVLQGGAAAHGGLQIQELDPKHAPPPEIRRAPLSVHTSPEAPHLLNPYTIELSASPRASPGRQTSAGNAMQILDAVEALRTSAKVCCTI